MNEADQYQITFEWDDEDFYQDSYQTLSRLPTPDVLAEKSEIALQASLQTVQEIGQRFAERLRESDHPPKVAELEFGIRLGANAGIITKDNSQAHFVIKLVWKS